MTRGYATAIVGALVAGLVGASCADTATIQIDAGADADVEQQGSGGADIESDAGSASDEDAADADTNSVDEDTTDAVQPETDGGGVDAAGVDAAGEDAGLSDTTLPDTADPRDVEQDTAENDPDIDPDTDTADTSVDRETRVCERWSSLRELLVEDRWDGDVAACEAGDMSDEWRDRVLESINTHRFIAGMPPVTRDPGRDDLAQSCALLMHANGRLSHDPPDTWACFSDAGATGAGASNIAQSPGMSAMDLYMVDFGNESTFGHRRWFLSNSLGPVGVGSTNRYSCHYVLGGRGSHDAAWVAWPPPGPVPIELMDPITSFRGPSVDEIGWTLQSDSINLNDATVSVRNRGEDRPVEVWSLLPRYGSQYAIAFRPVGWTSSVDESYDITVVAGDRTIEWAVQFIGCGG